MFSTTYSKGGSPLADSIGNPQSKSVSTAVKAAGFVEITVAPKPVLSRPTMSQCVSSGAARSIARSSKFFPSRVSRIADARLKAAKVANIRDALPDSSAVKTSCRRSVSTTNEWLSKFQI